MSVKFLLITFLIYGVQTQNCGLGVYPGQFNYEILPQTFPGQCQQITPAPSFIQNPQCNPPCLNVQPTINLPSCLTPKLQCANIPVATPIIPNIQCPNCITPNIQCANVPVPSIQNPVCPSVTTTVIDNSLANSLANAIQLLIVSNLIENTLGCSNNCDTNFEIADFYPNYCDYFEPYTPVIEMPCIQDIPYTSYTRQDMPYTSYTRQEIPYTTCIESPCYQACGPVVNTLVEAPCNFGYPVTNYGCEPVGTLAPVAAEVLFPPAIPAQLRCNFGYMGTNVPCVSVNVEPLPFDCGCNNGYYY